MSEWISVKDRLPIIKDAALGSRYSDSVLVNVDGNLQYVAWLVDLDSSGEPCEPTWISDSPIDDVTHWQPLPEPPNE
ncbi:MAG: DUF551 domain-containing protein [Gammaproteobacteria bacterium]|nr:DUF551 domain-containing protein [Gammaproteobacteria bacterium]